MGIGYGAPSYGPCSGDYCVRAADGGAVCQVRFLGRPCDNSGLLRIAGNFKFSQALAAIGAD